MHGQWPEPAATGGLEHQICVLSEGAPKQMGHQSGNHEHVRHFGVGQSVLVEELNDGLHCCRGGAPKPRCRDVVQLEPIGGLERAEPRAQVGLPRRVVPPGIDPGEDPSLGPRDRPGVQGYEAERVLSFHYAFEHVPPRQAVDPRFLHPSPSDVDDVYDAPCLALRAP